MIVLDHLSKTYVGSAGAHEALCDINLHVEPGDVFGIIGQSGAGKSTLVRCINLLERPTAGRVLIDRLFAVILYVAMIFAGVSSLQNM